MDDTAYEVVVEVAIGAGHVDAAYEELTHANSVEVHDPDYAILRVTEQVAAPTEWEAYRQAANVTDAQLRAGGIRPRWFDHFAVRLV
jgi:hypothetical protein